METEIDLRAYIEVIVRHWWKILALFLIAAITAYLVSLTLPPVYEAKALVAIIKAKSEVKFEPKFETISEQGFSDALEASRRQTLMGLVANGSIAQEVSEELRDVLDEGERVPSILLDSVKGKVGGDGEGKAASSDVIVISAKSNDPQKATMVANAWAKAYERYINDIYTQASPAYSESLESELEEAKQDYEEAQATWEAFIAENRVDELNRLTAEKQAIIACFQEGKQTALNAAIEERVETQRQIIAAYLAAQSANRLLAFNKEQEGLRNLASAYIDARNKDRTQVFQKQEEAFLEKLGAYYGTKHKLERLLEDAKAMKKQIAEGGKGAALTNGLAVVLLKAQVFATSTELPGSLQIQVDAIPDPDSEALVRDLDTLITTIEGRLRDLEERIQASSEELISGKGYNFYTFPVTDSATLEFQKTFPALFKEGELAALSAEIPLDNPLMVNAQEAFQELLQMAGLETLPKYTAEASELNKTLDELQDEMRVLQSKLEQEEATKKELEQDRDLAWDTFTTLQRKVAEIRLVANVPGTEVRFAAPALPPRKPISPNRGKNTILGAGIGLILGVLGAFLIEYIARLDTTRDM